MNPSPGVTSTAVRSKPEPASPQLSIVIPVYNESESLPRLWEELRAVLPSAAGAWEVVFVDDGSDDGSAEVLRAIRRSWRGVRVLRLDSNMGQTAALLAGFRVARGEVVISLDADGQNDPADIPRLLARMPEFDVVAGYREHRADGLVRRLSSCIANAVRNAVSGDDIIDTGCTLKAFRKEALQAIPAFNGMHRFLPTLVRLAGFKVCQVPVGHRPRAAGRSKYGIANRLFRGVEDLMAVRWMKHRHVRYRATEEKDG